MYSAVLQRDLLPTRVQCLCDIDAPPSLAQLPAPHADAVLAHPAFTTRPEAGGAGDISSADIEIAGGASASTSGGATGVHATGSRPAPGVASSLVRKEDEPRSPWAPILHKRIVQHNVRVAAKWYDAVTAPRLAALLGVDAATAEATVAELVSDKALYAKIDRPAGEQERVGWVGACGGYALH